MPHRVYKFVHLQLFDVKLLFCYKNIFRKHKRMAVYGPASLILDIKLTQKNDDLLSSRHRYIFEVPHPLHEYAKMRISNKRYQTNRVHTFWGPWSASALRYFGVDHFGMYCTKTYEKQEELWDNKFQCAWLSCWGFAYVLCTGCFPLHVSQWTQKKLSEGFRQRGWKDSDRPLFREDESI